MSALPGGRINGWIWKAFNPGGIAREHNLFCIFLREPKSVMVWESLLHSVSPFLHATNIFMPRNIQVV